MLRKVARAILKYCYCMYLKMLLNINFPLIRWTRVRTFEFNLWLQCLVTRISTVITMLRPTATAMMDPRFSIRLR